MYEDLGCPRGSGQDGGRGERRGEGGGKGVEGSTWVRLKVPRDSGGSVAKRDGALGAVATQPLLAAFSWMCCAMPLIFVNSLS